jgi:hypothetical protein
VPQARIEVQHRSGFLGEVGITWKDLGLVPPWLDDIPLKNPRAPTERFAQRFAWETSLEKATSAIIRMPRILATNRARKP